jgi:peptidylprolyl isomerase
VRLPGSRLPALLVAACLVLTACGSGDDGDASSSGGGGTGDLPEVTGRAGSTPQLADGTGDPPSGLVAETLSEGEGEEVAKGDLLVAHYVGQTWQGKTFDSSWQRGQPAAFPIGVGQVIKGWDEALVGVPAGSRVELSVPPSKGYGKQGNAQAGIEGDDTLVFVVDVLGSHGADDGASGSPVRGSGGETIPVEVGGPASGRPEVSVDKKATAPSGLTTRTLVRGDGPKVTKGQTLVTQYEGVTLDDGKTFDSSWQRGQPAAFPIGVGQVIKGWDEALVGVRVGSRVLVSIPPEKGYGKKGNPQAGIEGDDTLVFVVDVLGAYGG